MGLTPITFVIFMIAFTAAGVAVAAAVWHVHENRRHANMIRLATLGALLALFALVVFASWNDAGAATSLLSQRLFLVVVLITAFVACIAHVARRLSGFPHRKLLVLVSVVMAGGVVGTAIGTTDWQGVASTGDYMMRGMLAIWALVALTGALTPLPDAAVRTWNRPPPPAPRPRSWDDPE